jgi:hypothetical protein
MDRLLWREASLHYAFHIVAVMDRLLEREASLHHAFHIVAVMDRLLWREAEAETVDVMGDRHSL